MVAEEHLNELYSLKNHLETLSDEVLSKGDVSTYTDIRMDLSTVNSAIKCLQEDGYIPVPAEISFVKDKYKTLGGD